MLRKKAPTSSDIERRVTELEDSFRQADDEYESLNAQVAQLLYDGEVEKAESFDARMQACQRRMDSTAEAVKLAKKALADAQQRESDSAQADLRKAVGQKRTEIDERSAALAQSLAQVEEAFLSFQATNVDLTRLMQQLESSGANTDMAVRRAQVNRTIWNLAPAFAAFCKLPRPALRGSGEPVAGLVD